MTRLVGVFEACWGEDNRGRGGGGGFGGGSKGFERCRQLGDVDQRELRDMLGSAGMRTVTARLEVKCNKGDLRCCPTMLLSIVRFISCLLPRDFSFPSSLQRSHWLWYNLQSLRRSGVHMLSNSHRTSDIVTAFLSLHSLEVSTKDR